MAAVHDDDVTGRSDANHVDLLRASAEPQESSSIALTCTLVSGDIRKVLKFRADTSKKAAFWIDPLDHDEEDKDHKNSQVQQPPSVEPDTGDSRSGQLLLRQQRTIAAPAQCSIECSSASSSFFMGGFQLVSNAKMIEVYLDGSYLTTCRGISSSAGVPPGYFKVLYVVPGGPRSIRSATLKLLSLQATDQTTTEEAQLVMMKLTARLAPSQEIQQPSTRRSNELPVFGADHSATLTDPRTEANVTTPRTSSCSTATKTHQMDSSTEDAHALDMSSALAALSMMMRSAEERIVSATTRQLQSVLGPWQHEHQQLTTTLASQIQFQNQLLVQQQTLLQSQQLELVQLRQEQSELRNFLEQELAGLRHKESSTNNVPQAIPHPVPMDATSLTQENEKSVIDSVANGTIVLAVSPEHGDDEKVEGERLEPTLSEEAIGLNDDEESVVASAGDPGKSQPPTTTATGEQVRYDCTSSNHDEDIETT